VCLRSPAKGGHEGSDEDANGACPAEDVRPLKSEHRGHIENNREDETLDSDGGRRPRGDKM